MTELTIQLPENFVIPQYVNQLTPDDWVSILNLIGRFSCISEPSELSNEPPIQSITPLIKRLEEELEEQRIRNNVLTEQLETNLKYLKPLLKFHTGTNNDKGTLGENFINNTLADMFPDAVLHDTSGKAAAGDIVFEWRGFKIMIEVKNKQTITQTDLDKFLRDMDQNDYNAGIFLSFHTNVFPGRSRENIQLDFHNGKPLVYMHANMPCNELNFVMRALYQILNVPPKQQDNFQVKFSELFKLLVIQIEFIQAEIRRKEKELQSYNKQIGQLIDAQKDCQELFESIREAPEPEPKKTVKTKKITKKEAKVSNKPELELSSEHQEVEIEKLIKTRPKRVIKKKASNQ